MDKILIISNARHKELGQFIQQRGAFEVIGCYSSISENVLDIQDKIIDVSKTLYLYQPEEAITGIRTDMNVLETMIKSNGFFKPGEISFITRNTPECKQAEKYFITVMKSCNYSNYVVKNIDDVISFTTVYDSLMGISTNEDFKNTYKTYYRTERDVESTEEYEAQDDSDLIIEPFSFDNLKDYKHQVEIVSGMNSTIEFKDKADFRVETKKNPNLGEMEAESVLGNSKVIVLTGKPKSGLSMWTAALASSCAAAGRSICILDYTTNSDVQGHFGQDGVEFNELTMKQILHGDTLNKGINLLSLNDDTERKVKFNFIRNVFSNRSLPYDVILFPVDYRFFTLIIDLIKDEIDSVFITCVPRFSDVSEIIDLVDWLQDVDTTVISNDVFSVQTRDHMKAAEIKDALSIISARVVDSIKFNSVKVGPKLGNALLK